MNLPDRHRRQLLPAVGFLTAGAATPSTGSAATTSTPTTTSPSESAPGSGPGVQENDGIPESQEHHGRHGHGLDLSGTVTAVTADSTGTTGTVSIQTASGTTTYTVDAGSDIDKNGESQLSALAVGDAVTFSVNGTTIDKLHAGDESRNRPAEAPASSATGNA